MQTEFKMFTNCQLCCVCAGSEDAGAVCGQPAARLPVRPHPAGARRADAGAVAHAAQPAGQHRPRRLPCPRQVRRRQPQDAQGAATGSSASRVEWGGRKGGRKEGREGGREEGRKEGREEGRKEGYVLFNDALNTFYLWLYGIGHMVKDHSDSERGTMGYSFRLTARVLLYAPSHRQGSTYHGLSYTSRRALAGARNSSMGPPHEGSIRRPIAP